MSSICHINHPRTQEHSYENAEILKLTTLSRDHNTRVLLSKVACKFIPDRWSEYFLHQVLPFVLLCNQGGSLADLKITIKSV